MILKHRFALALLVGFFQLSFAQHNYGDYNRMGVYGGLTMFEISTPDLNTQQRDGFIAGFTTRGSFYNDFDLVFGINFANSQVGILGRERLIGLGEDSRNNRFTEQYIDYTIESAQVTLLASYNIIEHHLSLEAGPILNINGKLKLDNDRYQDYVLDGYNSLRAGDIQDISKVNLHLAGGITAGVQQFRVSAQYQYGVTNTLDKLNDHNLEKTDFKGHNSLLTFAAIFYF